MLRLLRCDAALLLRDDHWWGAALALLAGIPQRLGYDLPLCRPLLSQVLPPRPGSHVGRQALDLVAALAAAPPPMEPPTLQFTPTAADQAWATGWLAEHLAPGEQLIVLHPGTGGPSKHWLPVRWAVVADGLAQPGRRILLTGGPSEAELLHTVAAAMQTPPLILAGQASIGRLAALLGRAALVLGVDSGPLHIAVSQGTPSLHLFGPSDPARFGPWGSPERHIVLRAGIWCSPCGVFAACPRGTDPPECMAQLEVEAVLQAARSLLVTP
jgi:ADP-heptose:LPS heptosyltransferase